MVRSGLGRRVRLDRVRLRGLFGGKQARLGAWNIVLYWIFFLTMLTLMVSGGLLYFDLPAGHDLAMLHWCGTWVITAFAGLHVLAQYRYGGASQVLRIFRPAWLTAPLRQLDAVELLTLLAEQSERPSQVDGFTDAALRPQVWPDTLMEAPSRDRPAVHTPAR